MSDQASTDCADTPATVSSLVDDLRMLGVEPGMTVMVHASLSKLGYVVGGAPTVVTALLQAVGDGGTLVMPTHSTDLTDPAGWRNPPVPEASWPRTRAEMPAYDPAQTPARDMGVIAECFRQVAGVARSGHPTVSAAAIGPNAAFITDGHELAMGLGESSPQARLYDVDGHVLLLGVEHGNNTSLHLAERRSAPDHAAVVTQSSPMMVDGRRSWVTYDCLDDDPGDFATIGEAFAATANEVCGTVASATARLMRSRTLVDFATEWMNGHRVWR